MNVTSWEEQRHTSLKTVVNVQTTSGGMENQDISSSTALTKGEFSTLFRVVGFKTQKRKREKGGTRSESRDASGPRSRRTGQLSDSGMKHEKGEKKIEVDIREV
jgi:hypothetical protein